MEGGKATGKDVFEAARAFAKMGKLWKIHFRNVTAPIPYFVETYIDNGYTDMWKLMKTLVDVDFRGNLIADHVPAMAGGATPHGHTVWDTSVPCMRLLKGNDAKANDADGRPAAALCRLEWLIPCASVKNTLALVAPVRHGVRPKN